MSINKEVPATQTSAKAQQPAAQRLGQWIQDPLGSVVAASAATIGSFGLVLSGMWLINLAVQ